MTDKRRKNLLKTLCHRQPSVSVLLENVFDPHNIAAVFRTCDSVGIQEVYILNTKNIAKPKKWSKRTSGSSNKWLDIYHYDNLSDCIRHVKQKYQTLITTYLGKEYFAKDLYSFTFPKSFIIALGNETLGLSKELMKYSDTNIIIPQSGIIQSLNISVSSSIIFYEQFRQKQHLKKISFISKDFEAMYKIKIKQWNLD